MNEDSADRLLLAAATDGDHSAFLILFRRYGTRIFKFLYRFLGSAKTAEDLTHDCFLELARNSENVRFTDNSPLIQLYSTARQLALERSPEHTEGTRPDGEIDEDSVEAVKQSIKALPCVERETLILFEYEGLSIRDIGQIVEANDDVVQMRLNHAREKMRTAFKLVFLLLTFVLFSSPASSQIPFYTDDADTTPKGKFHIEFFNEHDWLQKSSLPGQRQNTSNFTLNYGLTDRVELGVNAPLIKIFNSQESRFGSPSGIGDMQFGVKVKLRDEREESSLPAMTVVFYVEAPTGSTRKQLGSGLTDYWLYGVLQKSLTKRTVARVNGGILFAGNSSTGLIGIEASRGQVFTGNGSLVRDFKENVKLGIEVFGGVTNDFNLSRGQLEAQIGGSYAVLDDFTFTFGVLAGRFPASPRVGIHVGFAYDFK